MGRGSGEDRAIRLATIPRRLRGPKEIGQRRYRVAHQKDDGSLGGEPGYIRSIHESSRRRWDARRMVIVEEAAVADQNGKLHWLDSNVILASRYDHWASVGEVRDACDRLNKEPLGPNLVSEVDEKSGRLVIKKIRRRYSSAGRSYPAFIEEVDKMESFDVEDPAQAKKAKEVYQAFKEDVNQEKQLAAESLLDKLRSQGDKRARHLYPSQEIADRSRAAADFSEALDKGEAEEILKEQAEVKEDAVQDKERSRRAQETINALSKT